MSVEWFKERLSLETSLVHHSHEVKGSRDCIPLFENLCYCLALFRCHTVEKGVEATLLLDRLLAFQNAEGAFPTYIHDYPAISRPLGPFHALLPLHLIKVRYGHVIESRVRTRLNEAHEQLVAYCKRCAAPPLLAERLAAIEGEVAESYQLRSSKEWAHHVLSSQLTEPVQEVSIWHPNLDVYCGAPYDERQYGSRSQKQLIPPQLSPLLVAAPLPQASLQASARIEIDRWVWNIQNGTDHSIAVIEQFSPSRVPKGFHLIRALFENDISFVLPSGNYSYQDGLFTMSEEIPDYRDTMELSFYITRHPDVDITVEGQKATAFRKGERVGIRAGNHRIELKFDSEDDYYGHISYGDRPMQMEGDKFTSFDWRIAIRTVKRVPNSQLRVGLSIATPMACIPLST